MVRAVELPLRDIDRCAADGAFVERMERLYAELAGQVSVQGAVCVNRGACCRFGEFGHRLYVTTAEVAYFLAKVQRPIRRPRRQDAGGGPVRTEGEIGQIPLLDAGQEACPYQEGGKCVAREARPGGCRIFFCESASLGWQQAVSEAFLERVKGVHQDFGLPYVYLDWLAALEQVGELTGPEAGT